MGFLFDSLKNLVGDIQCAALTLDCDVNEKSCDRYTGAKTSVCQPTNSITNANNNITNNTSSSKNEDVLVNNSDCTNAIKSISKMIKSILDDDNSMEKVDNTGVDTDILAKELFSSVFKAIRNNGFDINVSNILANTVASMIIEGRSIGDISVTDIIDYCKSANVADADIVYAVNTFSTSNVENIIKDIEKSLQNNKTISSAIKKAEDKQGLKKPFTMDFSQFVKNNQDTMPQLV